MHYAALLFGRHFTIRTDHRALVALLKSKVLNNRLYGCKLKIQAYDFVIEYHPGRQNVVADAFSRQFWSSSEQVYSEMMSSKVRELLEHYLEKVHTLKEKIAYQI